MVDSLTKMFPSSVSVTESVAIQEEATTPADLLFLAEEDYDIPDLNALHSSLEHAQENEDAATHIQLMYGSDWDKLLTLDEARRRVDKWFDDNKLEIGQSSSNLLSENRREPYSNYAIKTRRPKGNRHIYGRLPYIQAKKTIYELVLLKWLEEHVKPHAKPRKEVA